MERSRVRILASRGLKHFATTSKSGRWDPRVRSDRRVGPACQVGSDRRVGPACQVGPTRGTRVSGRVGPTCGTRVSGRTDAWDPRVRSDRHVGPVCQVGPTRGPACQVGLTKFKCMTDGSYTPRKKMSPILHIRKINTWILHIGVNIHVDDTLAKLMRWQSNHFKYILN
jgi:hypothetical protein